MRLRILVALATIAACFAFATPASAQAWGIGPQISRMAQNDGPGNDHADWIWRNRQQWLQQTQQGPPYGKAWGLRGGKEYTGNGNPPGGVPNGRPFRQRRTLGDRFRGGYRGVREFPRRVRENRGIFRGRGRGRGRGRR